MIGERQVGQIVKPGKHKKQKKVNGWKGKPDRYCAFCGQSYAQRHEVFYGTANRQISIDEGFQIDVCDSHHRLLHENLTPWAQDTNRTLRRKFQSQWERERISEGIAPEEARERWIILIGRNYIDD